MRHSALLLAITLATGILAQSSGTEHWLTFMENLNLAFNQPPSFIVVISSDFDTDGEVTFPATGFSLPFSVAAGHDTVLTLPTNIYYPEGDEDIVNFGMRILADEPVSVYAYHERQYFSEASLVLPYDRLASDYTVLAHEDAYGSDPSEFVVLATADSTTVEITPSILTMGFRPPGEPFTVVLDEGQVFQVQGIGDLTGTRVRSLDPEKRLAVFSGARQANVGCIGGADDHLYDAALPEDLWSTRFIPVSFKDRGGDEIRIISAVDGNTVTIGNLAPVTLNTGEVYSTTVSGAVRIIADAPITVGQFNESQDCNPQPGDPCFLWNLPSSHTDTRFIWSSLDIGTPQQYVNIVVPGAAGAPPVFLDGVNIAAQFTGVPGATGFFYAQVGISSGEHELTCEAGAWATVYGFGDYNGYAFSLGFEVADGSTGIGEPLPERGPARTIVMRPGDALPGWVDLPMDGRIEIHGTTGRLMAVVRGAQRGAGLDLGTGLFLYRTYPGAGRPSATGRLIIQP